MGSHAHISSSRKNGMFGEFNDNHWVDSCVCSKRLQNPSRRASPSPDKLCQAHPPPLSVSPFSRVLVSPELFQLVSQ